MINECLEIRQETAYFCKVIASIRHSVSSPDQTPQSSSKILRCASYF